MKYKKTIKKRFHKKKRSNKSKKYGGSSSEAEERENIVFSYQGAFGPPTYGHYKSMEAFIQRIMKDYNRQNTNTNYTFLFMPTKSSSSKPHLSVTMDQRQRILQLFSNKLKNKYPNVTIAPSRIEFDKETSSDTINTIEELQKQYRNHKIILGMGKDNALQLPYWGKINKYKDNVESIYLVKRDVKGETRDFKNNQGEIIGTFDITPPTWFRDPNILSSVFGIRELVDNKIPINSKINIKLPKIIEIDENIPSSSSSMIRHFISRIIKNEDVREENQTKIKHLMFGTDEFKGDEGIDEILNSVIEDYKRLYNDENKVRASLDSSYDEEGYDIEYDTYMSGINSQVSKGNSQVSNENSQVNTGGKSKKSKSMKKRRKSGKRISKKSKNMVAHHKLERKINH